MKSCKRLGIKSVAIFSEADRYAVSILQLFAEGEEIILQLIIYHACSVLLCLKYPVHVDIFLIVSRYYFPYINYEFVIRLLHCSFIQKWLMKVFVLAPHHPEKVTLIWKPSWMPSNQLELKQ